MAKPGPSLHAAIATLLIILPMEALTETACALNSGTGIRQTSDRFSPSTLH